jgi:tol-pal system protein YbgF
MSRRFISGTRLSRLCLCAALALAPVFLASPAAAQQTEMRPLLDRLDRMERELNLLQRQVYQGRVRPGAPAPGPGALAPGPEAAGLKPSIAARMEVRLSELDSELRTLTGKVEEMTFALDQLRARIEKLVGDVDLRLSMLEQSATTGRTGDVGSAVAEGVPVGAFEGEGGSGRMLEKHGTRGAAGTQLGAAVPGAPAGAGTQLGAAIPGERAEEAPSPPTEMAAAMSVLPEGTPREQYDHVFARLRQADYAAAERGLRAFVAVHPDDALAENAQYWLGETYYVRSDYANAAVVFAEGFQKFSDGSKAPDNLLKLGMSLARLGETEQACKVLGELQKKFAASPPNIRERATKEQTRIGCE